LRPFQNFDPFNLLAVSKSEIETAAGRTWIIHRHPIDQHQRLLAGCAADANGCAAAESAVLVDGHAGSARNRIDGKIEPEFFDIVRRNDADG